MVKTVSKGVRIPLDLYDQVKSINKGKTFSDVVKKALYEKYNFIYCALEKQKNTSCAQEKLGIVDNSPISDIIGFVSSVESQVGRLSSCAQGKKIITNSISASDVVDVVSRAESDVDELLSCAPEKQNIVSSAPEKKNNAPNDEEILAPDTCAQPSDTFFDNIKDEIDKILSCTQEKKKKEMNKNNKRGE